MTAQLRRQASLARIGTRLAERYTLLELIGRGGMPAVYVARDASLGKNVALKLLDTADDDQSADAQRFRREYYTLASLERLVAQGFLVQDRAACARGDLLRARGEAEAARALLLETVRGLAPRNLLMRQWIGSSLADASLACGMHAEARAEAEAVLAVGDTHADAALLLPRLRAERIRALAMAAQGEAREAVFVLERTIAQAEERGVWSLAGLAHEARARIALSADDRVAYRHHAAECERHFRATGNASLLAIHDRLLSAGDRARTATAGPDDAEDTIASGPHDTIAGPDADTRTISSRRRPNDAAP